MAFVNAQQSRVFLGALHLSGYLKGASSNATVNMLDTTTILDTAFQFIPGQDTSTFNLDMILDVASTAGGQADTLNTWKGATASPITFAPFATTASTQVQLVGALEATYTTSSTIAGLVLASVATQTDGSTDFGIILDPLTGVTGDGSTTGIDNTAATSNGGIAHLHVTAFSGLTSDAIIVEHSTNNSVWSTLGTFTTVTATTSQRLVIAPGTTVNRYLRVTDDVTGTGTCTRLVAFARR